MRSRHRLAIPGVCALLSGCTSFAQARDHGREPRTPDASAVATSDAPAGEPARVDDAPAPDAGVLALPVTPLDAAAPPAATAPSDDSGAPASGSELSFLAPAPAVDCQTQLRRLGVTFVPGRNAEGIADPVTVTTPINDVHFLASSMTGPERPLLMDCHLALALHEMTLQLRNIWGITDLVHFGVYNYRCMPNTDPCRLSRHALGLAIDIHSFRDRERQVFSVASGFWANGRPTCPPRAADGEDQTLKDIACWLHNGRTFSILLTPNYNNAHRNHFHFDLSPQPVYFGADLFSEIDPERFPGHGAHPDSTDDAELQTLTPTEDGDDEPGAEASCLPLSNTATGRSFRSARCWCTLRH